MTGTMYFIYLYHEKNILRQLPVHEETTVKQSYRAV